METERVHELINIDNKEKAYCIKMLALKRLRNIEKYRYIYALCFMLIAVAWLAIIIYTSYRCLFADVDIETINSSWLTLLLVLKFDILLIIEVIACVGSIDSFGMVTADLLHTGIVEESLECLDTSIQVRRVRKILCADICYTVTRQGVVHGRIFQLYFRSISVLDKSNIRYLEQLKLEELREERL